MGGVFDFLCFKVKNRFLAKAQRAQRKNYILGKQELQERREMDFNHGKALMLKTKEKEVSRSPDKRRRGQEGAKSAKVKNQTG